MWLRPTDKLVPARRQAVNQETQRIRTTMTFPQRRRLLHSPEFSAAILAGGAADDSRRVSQRR